MNERERADALARAIDELIRGAQTPEPHFDDEELRSLLRVAGARLQQGSQAALKAADHETAVWQRLVARLESGAESDHSEVDGPVAGDDMRDVVAARRRVSEDVLALAEEHREDVWRRVQERISTKRRKPRGIFSFLQARTDGDVPVERTPASRTRLILTGDSEVDSLIRVALGHTSLREAGEREISGAQAQLQARRRSDPARRHATAIESAAAGFTFWLRAGAVAAVVVAAVTLGPIPVTGLSGSPAAEAARFVAEHLGVTETDPSLPAPGASTSVSGLDMTAAEAAAQLGLPVSAPDQIMGLSLGSQRLFPRGISTTGTGTFVATYAGADGSVTMAMYEEAAGGSDFAVPTGSAVDMSVGASPATYFEGGWSSSENGSLTWQATGIQSLVFERDGVRFAMKYAGPHIEPSDFAAAAAAIG